MTPRARADMFVAEWCAFAGVPDQERFGVRDEFVAMLSDAIERAIREAVDEAVTDAIAERRGKPMQYGEVIVTADFMARSIIDTEKRAAKEEREACAEIADDFCESCPASNQIAAAIRARSRVTP